MPKTVRIPGIGLEEAGRISKGPRRDYDRAGRALEDAGRASKAAKIALEAAGMLSEKGEDRKKEGR